MVLFPCPWASSCETSRKNSEATRERILASIKMLPGSFSLLGLGLGLGMGATARARVMECLSHMVLQEQETMCGHFSNAWYDVDVPTEQLNYTSPCTVENSCT